MYDILLDKKVYHYEDGYESVEKSTKLIGRVCEMGLVNIAIHYYVNRLCNGKGSDVVVRDVELRKVVIDNGTDIVQYNFRVTE